jgi:hypothetical protein
LVIAGSPSSPLSTRAIGVILSDVIARFATFAKLRRALGIVAAPKPLA